MSETQRYNWSIPEWNSGWSVWQSQNESMVNNIDSAVFGNLEASKSIFKQVPNARVYDDGGTIKLELTSDLILVSRTLNTAILIDSSSDLELLSGYLIGASITPGATGEQETSFELYDAVDVDPYIQIFGYVTDAYSINWFNGTVLDLGDSSRRIFSDAAAAGSDTERVKVSGADTTANWLGTKLVAGGGISLAILNGGSNETFEITADAEWTRTTGSPGYVEPATATDTIRIGAGTVSQPGIACSIDDNTGIYWLTSDNFGIVTNGTERVRIDENGFMGVGQQTPVCGVHVGSAATGHSLNSVDDILVSGKFEVDGISYFDGGVLLQDGSGLVFGSGNDSLIQWSTGQSNDSLMVAVGDSSKTLLITEYSDIATDYSLSNMPNPSIIIMSSDASETLSFSTIAWNNHSIGGSKGSFLNIKSMSELVTVSVGNGSGGVVTSGNLAPANSLIFGVSARVTDAPGGGATEYDIGVTGGGNQAALIDGAGVSIGTTAVSAGGNDGTALPIQNASDTTLTVTTDSDVTVDDMILRVVVYYMEIIASTS